MIASSCVKLPCQLPLTFAYFVLETEEVGILFRSLVLTFHKGYTNDYVNNCSPYLHDLINL